MPRIFRGMLPAEVGKPMPGPDGKMLAVRGPSDVEPGAHADVIPDASGNISPRSGGMSVAPSLADLPDHRIPKRLRSTGIRRARGPSSLQVWRLGEGPFVDAPLTDQLNLRLDPRDRRTVWLSRVQS